MKSERHRAQEALCLRCPSKGPGQVSGATCTEEDCQAEGQSSEEGISLLLSIPFNAKKSNKRGDDGEGKPFGKVSLYGVL